MPIQLDKILNDICGEKALHPNNNSATKQEIEEAWSRVGKNNKLSVHETRSIFKVLQKKYEQEKEKVSSAWKLFTIMDQIHKVDVKEEQDSDALLEEDEEYEMLEVQEEEEQSGATQASANNSASDADSPGKTLNNSGTSISDKNEKTTAIKSTLKNTTVAAEEKKLLNTMATHTTRATNQSKSSSTVTAAALHKKGITMKKTTALNNNNSGAGGGSVSTAAASASASASFGNTKSLQTAAVNATSEKRSSTGSLLEVGKTIQLPESIKRKLSEEQMSIHQAKKMNIQLKGAGNATANNAQPLTTTAQLMQVKHEREDMLSSAAAAASAATQGYNVITIPANGLAGTAGGASSSVGATMASTSTNGFSPRIEDIDFRNDIIFDTGTAVNGPNGNAKLTGTGEVINLGNFDNSLPPTFFKNLCNSSRHEALGLYVANVMNRLPTRFAAKLELQILRSIIDIIGDNLEQ